MKISIHPSLLSENKKIHRVLVGNAYYKAFNKLIQQYSYQRKELLGL